MKQKYLFGTILLSLVLMNYSGLAQENESKKSFLKGLSFKKWAEKEAQREEARPTEKLTFACPVLINNQTVKNLNKKTLDFTIQHRFGIISNRKDLWGLFAPANIRLGVSYGLTKRLTLGLGVSKFKQIYDANWKLALLRQTKENGMPLSVTYFGSVGRSDLPNSSFYNEDKLYDVVDRFFYFNELMIARKFSEKISMQLAAKYAHFNYVTPGTEHNVFGASFAGRYKFTKQSSVILEFDYPITKHTVNPQEPNLSLGYEVSTGGHQFQVFVGTSDNILDAQIIGYNHNDFTKRQVLIGFNITRLWNLKKQEK
ncbi:MAG: hypothetical protein EPN92_13360 [Chitinophagaceae bacterium]|nr:MAG: hypothetical protein EPN92_13360 [Chitinophagaceae bacterium]